MTGQHTGHTPVRGNKPAVWPGGTKPTLGQFPLPGEAFTLAELFKGAGYATGMFGKWGLGAPGNSGDPLTQGFDTFYGHYCQGRSHTYYSNYIWNNYEKVELDGDTYTHDLMWDRGLDFIKVNGESGTPFFAYFSILVPHAAMAAPPELHEKWKKVYPEFNTKAGKYSGFDMGKDKVVMNPIAGFAAMMDNLDQQVGELQALLKELGLEENTIVIFTSDNGAHHEGGHSPVFWDSNGPLRGTKRDLTEGGIRTPMLISWPAVIKPGRTTDHVSAFWDFMPTFAEIIDGEYPEGLDGISMLPTLQGDLNAQRKHDCLYWEFTERAPRKALRSGKWKLIKTYDPSGAECLKTALYDLSNDLSEESDLAANNPELVERLEQMMEREHRPSPYFKFQEPRYKPGKKNNAK